MDEEGVKNLGRIPSFSFYEAFRTLRVHQWVKNFLLFVPAIMSHSFFTVSVLSASCLAFISFSFMASAGYIANDLKDIESDKLHAKKSKRPIASGCISKSSARLLMLCCIAFSLSLCFFLPKDFLIILIAYFCLTNLYTAYFKKQLVIDIVMLACLYALRILAGGMATGLTVTPWLLAFSVFIFYSLACIKRYSELISLRKSDTVQIAGRAYTTDDTEKISVFGIASGLIAVLVLALYINGSHVDTLYSRPEALWALCPVILYWITRAWILAGRGEVNEDPILFALKDRVSYVTAVVALVLIFLAI